MLHKVTQTPTVRTMDFPSPVAFYLGPWPIHWYGLSYAVGILLAWMYGRMCLRAQRFPGIRPDHLDEFINWALLGIVLGGRLGHILLYAPEYYRNAPLEALKVWNGGMAFHGGILGMACVMAIYCHRKAISFWRFADMLSCAAPLGLALGRIANFINQEVYGRPADVPWAVVFPDVDAVARHPSQLYEAASEGVLLWAMLALAVWNTTWPQRRGKLTGLFLMGYALARMLCEEFREPDGLWMGITLGQWYSLPFFLAGGLLFLGWVRRKNAAWFKM